VNKSAEEIACALGAYFPLAIFAKRLDRGIAAIGKAPLWSSLATSFGHERK
jgi:hypothetical protein